MRSGDRNRFMTMKAEKTIARSQRISGISMSRLPTSILGEAGMILTTSSATQLLPESYDRLALLADTDGIVVFPGFYGVTRDGSIATFSRGGSDITGAILAAALNAGVYENWTDVDSVYAVSPGLVRDPYPIREITYDEMRELAYAGFSVLHEEALVPAYRKGIPVHIRNTNNPSSRGTLIVSRRSAFDGIVTGIAGAKGFCSLTIGKYLMNREVGFALKVLGSGGRGHLVRPYAVRDRFPVHCDAQRGSAA